MYSSNSNIRAKAREALGNNIFNRKWLLLVLMMAVISIVLSAANYIGCGLGTLLLSGPLYVGIYGVCLKMVRGYEDIKFESAFEGCHKFGPNLILGLMQTLIVLLWSLLFIIPGIVKSYSYALAYYIRAEHPEYDWRTCLNESERMMRGHKWRLFTLHLSFIGWIFLSFFTCGIGSIWVNAYQQMATTVFYEELKSEYTHI